jgi:hypothetical protein
MGLTLLGLLFFGLCLLLYPWPVTFDDDRAILMRLEHRSIGNLPSNRELRDVVRRLTLAEVSTSPESAFLQAAISAPTLRIDDEFVRNLAVLCARTEAQSLAESGKGAAFTPNRVSLVDRLGSVLLILVIGAYTLWSLERNDFPVNIAKGAPLHLHGIAAWLMVGAASSVVAVLISVLLDHYDRRDNEAAYRQFVRVGSVLGWSLCGSALVVHFLAGFMPFLRG